jgi:hypothetical protein
MSYEEEDTCVDPRAILAVQRLGGGYMHVI